MQTRFDVIVAGSGIAGLSYALSMASLGHSVAILTKKDRAESNTNYAQGGIACVMDPTDSFDRHVDDTLVAGDGLCDRRVTEKIISQGPWRVRELMEWGMRFSSTDSGQPDLGREGGHSRRRILHVQDMTGRAIEKALLEAVSASPSIEVLEHFFVIDLITSAKLGRAADAGNDQVLGLYALDVLRNEVVTFRVPVVMLCTGGLGQVYAYTTNPRIATGDGIAIAMRAGVAVRNMEFIQFHPTTLLTAGEERFLISEAVRGEGGRLLGSDGVPFMERYHPQKELAPRDVVARAIDGEMKTRGMPHVWLDMTHHPKSFLSERFPQIYARCEEAGFQMESDRIPVVPAAHYSCGGILTDDSARTSLRGLYACGEVASTGLHGANRLASNSLLEALVLAHEGAKESHAYLRSISNPQGPLPEWVSGNVHDSDERVILTHNWDELRRTMWDYVGIVRTCKRLERALTRIRNLGHEIQEYYWNFRIEPDLLELRNLVVVAEAIILSAMERKESRGLHYILDYPDRWKHAVDTVVARDPEGAWRVTLDYRGTTAQFCE